MTPIQPAIEAAERRMEAELVTLSIGLAAGIFDDATHARLTRQAQIDMEAAIGFLWLERECAA